MKKIGMIKIHTKLKKRNPLKKISEIIQEIQTWKVIEWDELAKNLIDPDILLSIMYSRKLFKDDQGNYPIYDIIDLNKFIKIIKSLENDWAEPKDFSYEKNQLISNLLKFSENTMINFGVRINQYINY